MRHDRNTSEQQSGLPFRLEAQVGPRSCLLPPSAPLTSALSTPPLATSRSMGASEYGLASGRADKRKKLKEQWLLCLSSSHSSSPSPSPSPLSLLLLLPLSLSPSLHLSLRSSHLRGGRGATLPPYDFPWEQMKPRANVGMGRSDFECSPHVEIGMGACKKAIARTLKVGMGVVSRGPRCRGKGRGGERVRERERVCV